VTHRTQRQGGFRTHKCIWKLGFHAPQRGWHIFEFRFFELTRGPWLWFKVMIGKKYGFNLN